MSKIYTKNPKIEKVENRVMLECDNFLLVNYYPSSDKIAHFAFGSKKHLENAKSNYSVGKWVRK